MKKLMVIGVAVTIIIVTIIVLLMPQEYNLQLTTFKKSYNFVSEYQEHDEMKVEVFYNIEKNYYVNLDNLEHSRVVDSKTKDFILLKCKAIEYKYATTINDKRYFAYEYTFDVYFETNTNISFKMPIAVLEIDYVDDLSLNMTIGSFSLNKVNRIYNSQGINITNLSGIVNIVDSVRTLCGIVLSIKNNTNTNVRIDCFELLDASYSFSSSEMIDIQEFNNSANISDLLGYSYDYLHKNEEQITMEIFPGAEVQKLIPIKINCSQPLYKVGFRLEFTKNKEKCELFYAPFTFYSSMKYLDSEIEKLEFYAYELS